MDQILLKSENRTELPTTERLLSALAGDISLPLEQSPLLLFRLLICLEEAGHCDGTVLHFSEIEMFSKSQHLTPTSKKVK